MYVTNDWTTIESLTVEGAAPDRDSWDPSLSGDGYLIAFS